jgi:filamentous hemagglutinin
VSISRGQARPSFSQAAARVPIRVVNLPKGYLASADGKITGPRGVTYSPTSAFDGSGNQIFIDSTGNYYKLTSSGVSRVVSPNPASSIGVRGQIGESALKSLGGQSQVSLPTTQGGRVIDQLTLDGIANEAKVGYTTLDAFTALQVSKDAELLQTKAVKGVTWNFYSSPVTGQGGPSSALLKALSAAGIKVNIH